MDKVMRRWTHQGHFGAFWSYLVALCSSWLESIQGEIEHESICNLLSISVDWYPRETKETSQRKSKQCMSVRSTILHWNRWNIGILTHFKWSSKRKKLCHGTLFSAFQSCMGMSNETKQPSGGWRWSQIYTLHVNYRKEICWTTGLACFI